MHQNYPAQFGPIIPFLLKNYDVDISFFSEYVTKPVYPTVNHKFFRPVKYRDKDNPYFYTRFFEWHTDWQRSSTSCRKCRPGRAAVHSDLMYT